MSGKRVTGAKSVPELYETIRGHYLDEFDIQGVADELTNLVNAQRNSRTTQNSILDSGRKDVDVNEVKSSTDSVKPKESKSEKSAMIIGGITFFAIYIIVQTIVFIGWGNKGYPENEWFLGLLPTILVVTFFVIATINDMVAKIKEKRGKK